eukprot:6212662-Pleurochrysis_carterae.AAC.1
MLHSGVVKPMESSWRLLNRKSSAPRVRRRDTYLLSSCTFCHPAPHAEETANRTPQEPSACAGKRRIKWTRQIDGRVRMRQSGSELLAL